MSSATRPPVSISPIGAKLGEGPVWVARDNALWSVDIKERRIHRFDPIDGALRSWDAPAQIGWILPARGGGFVVGLQGGLHLFDPITGAFILYAEVERDRPRNRLNDACTDRNGRIWFGSMDDGESAATGYFYRCEGGTVTALDLLPVSITNGPAISPDGRLLYHTDTIGRVIHVCEIQGNGTLGPPRPFVTIADGEGYPDGPTVDAEGYLWTGLYAGWEARRYAPDGALTERVRFPVPNITKLAFGGPDLRTVYATTAWKGMSDEERVRHPGAGNLFSFPVDVPGLPVTEAVL